jgi:outer membrane lipoprotein SlyB
MVVGLALITATAAAVDLSQLQVTPQRGQSADQLRRDRYECHNWAVEQTGEVPSTTPAPNQDAADAAKRADRIGRIATGAAIGATLGGIFGGGHNYGEDIVKGAAVGSVVGVATGAAHDKKQQKQAGPEPGSDYLRALSACLEGRGYTVAMPAPATAAVAQR